MFIKILAPAYYARQDTKTPVKIGIKCMVANMVFNILLAPFFSYVGLAIATALSATLNAFLLYQGLKSAGVFQLTKATQWLMARVIFSALIMAGVVNWLSPEVEIWLSMLFIDQVIKLFTCITLGMLSYFISIALLGIRVADFKINSSE